MGNTGQKPSIKEAIANETPIGFMKRSSGNGPGGSRLYQAWRWNGKDWEKVSNDAWQAWKVTQEFSDLDAKLQNAVPKIGPIAGLKPDTTTLRWPRDTLTSSSDYIFFQFGKYEPPFSQDVSKLREGTEGALGSEKLRNELQKRAITSASYRMYNASNMLDVTGQDSILLPMPQDLSTELNQQWQGKQFTATGRAATAALAAGNFSYASEVVKNIAGNATALQNAFNTSVLNSIPGVGGNLEFNDVSGSTRGIVINPNAELLYDSPEMREVGMIFKMVPKNYKESVEINKIVKSFRRHSMPRWNTKDVDLTKGEAKTSGGSIDEPSGFNLGDMNNWIKVPDLCKFTFMTGAKANKHVIQYKPCAISGVEVNYTSDGTWNSYNDPGPSENEGLVGSPPVAVELRLNFMETKLIFAEEVTEGF